MNTVRYRTIDDRALRGRDARRADRRGNPGVPLQVNLRDWPRVAARGKRVSSTAIGGPRCVPSSSRSLEG